MKIKTILLSIVAAGISLVASAQGGYQDGIDYYNADRFDKAKIILDRTLNEPGTDKGLAYYYLGCIDLRNNDRAAAERNFQAGLAAKPDCPYNYVGMGQLALMSGNKTAAEQCFKDALKFNKKDPDVSAAIARAYFNVDPVKYAADIQKYIDKGLKDSKNLAPSIYVLQGDMAAAANDINAAAEFYEQAIVYDEMAGNVNPEAYIKYANIFTRVNHDYAIRKLEELKRKLPTSALAQSELAEKYYDAEQYRKAAEQYAEYMRNPNHFQQDEQRYCGLLFFDGKYPESLALAKNVLSQDPQNQYMFRMVMLNDARLENWAEAEEYGKKLFSLPGAQITTNDINTYATVLSKLGRPQEALAVYERGYNADPVKNREMLADMANIYLDMDDLANAVQYLQRYADSGETKLTDLFNLASYYAAYGASLPEGSAERTEAANRGIAILDANVGNAADASKGLFYNKRAQLLMVRDGNEPTPEIMSTFQQMKDAYGNDDTKNVSAFRTAYIFEIIDLVQKRDKAGARAVFERLRTLDPNFSGLPQFDQMTR